MLDGKERAFPFCQPGGCHSREVRARTPAEYFVMDMRRMADACPRLAREDIKAAIRFTVEHRFGLHDFLSEDSVISRLPRLTWILHPRYSQDAAARPVAHLLPAISKRWSPSRSRCWVQTAQWKADDRLDYRPCPSEAGYKAQWSEPGRPPGCRRQIQHRAGFPDQRLRCRGTGKCHLPGPGRNNSPT